MAGLLNVADVSIHYRQRTCHNIGPARERAFISVCENKGIKNNIYTIAVSKSTLVIGLMLINNGFSEPAAEPIQPRKINPHIELIPHCLWSNECRPTDKFSSTWPDLET